MNIKKGKDEVFFILLLLSMPAIEELWQLLTGKIDKKEFYNRFTKEKHKIISLLGLPCLVIFIFLSYIFQII